MCSCHSNNFCCNVIRSVCSRFPLLIFSFFVQRHRWRSCASEYHCFWSRSTTGVKTYITVFWYVCYRITFSSYPWHRGWIIYTIRSERFSILSDCKFNAVCYFLWVGDIMYRLNHTILLLLIAFQSIKMRFIRDGNIERMSGTLGEAIQICLLVLQRENRSIDRNRWTIINSSWLCESS